MFKLKSYIMAGILENLIHYYNYGQMLGKTKGVNKLDVYTRLEIIAITLGRDDHNAGVIKRTTSELKSAIEEVKKEEPIVWVTENLIELNECLRVLDIPMKGQRSYKMSEFKTLYNEARLQNHQLSLVDWMDKIGCFLSTEGCISIQVLKRKCLAEEYIHLLSA